MADNLLYPLVNALADCVKSVASIKNKVPNEALYPINNQYHLGDIYIPIGLRNKKDNVYLRIKDEQAHTFICGQTGSGKSNIVKVILSTIINQRPNVKLWLLDYKRVELSLFQNTKSCEVFEWDEEKISQRLNDLYELVLRRYDELAQKGMTECDSSYESIVCVIEEISLMDKKDMKMLRKIMAISRAVHIYIIFTTQRPDNTVIDNVVKSLIGNRICLKTDDKKNSIIALDREGCEELRGKGHGYLRSGGNTIEFQAFYITDEQVKQIVNRRSKEAKVIKTDNTNNTNTEWWGRL